MTDFPSTNILIAPLDDKSIKRLEEIKTYMEINGNPYHQNNCNPNKKEFHYFMGNSIVFIEEFKNKADINIVAYEENNLNSMKTNIEKIINEGLII